MGEYDALAELSQVADLPEQRALETGAMGMGVVTTCWDRRHVGGNRPEKLVRGNGNTRARALLWMSRGRGGSAKSFMVKRGAFKDCDIAITWHPGSIATVVTGSSLAAARVDFEFFGKASHASASPDLGRSALDAVELMNVGVNYMREHMSDRARIHYAYIDAGGISPNVVQAYANARYVVPRAFCERNRQINRPRCERRQRRGFDDGNRNEVAFGHHFRRGDRNTPLCQAMEKNLHMLGAPDFTDVDVAYAKRFQNTLGTEGYFRLLLYAGRWDAAG